MMYSHRSKRSRECAGRRAWRVAKLCCNCITSLSVIGYVTIAIKSGAGFGAMLAERQVQALSAAKSLGADYASWCARSSALRLVILPELNISLNVEELQCSLLESNTLRSNLTRRGCAYSTAKLQVQMVFSRKDWQLSHEIPRKCHITGVGDVIWLFFSAEIWNIIAQW